MDGLLVIKKETGMSSFQVVRQVGKILREKKVGHLGTLDPLATGVLVVAVGKGTKVIEYLDQSEKEYLATVKYGMETDTLDVTGMVIRREDFVAPDEKTLLSILSQFVGKYLQEVPIYSAVHVNGKRLYQYARDQQEVALPKREVQIKEMRLVSLDSDGFSFQCTVSKGTYIRSLVRDIGLALKIPCTMESLIRLRQGAFSLEEASSLEELRNGKYSLLSVSKVLNFFPQVVVDDFLVSKIKNGCKLPKYFEEKRALLVDSKGNALAIYQEDPNRPSWMRVLKML